MGDVREEPLSYPTRMSTLHIIWRRKQYAGRYEDRWYAYGTPESDACGGVWRERGMYRAEVWPHGRRILGAYYANPAKARQHIERWLQAHPHVACAAIDPRAIKGRIPRRPDPLLEQHVRLHPAHLIEGPQDLSF